MATKKKTAAAAPAKKPYVRPSKEEIHRLQIGVAKATMDAVEKGLLLTDVIEVFYFVAGRIDPKATIKMDVKHGR